MNADRAEGNGSGALLHGALTQRVLGVFFDVYNELGSGFLESVYAEAMAIALREAAIPFEREPTVAVHFRNSMIGAVPAGLHRRKQRHCGTEGRESH